MNIELSYIQYMKQAEDGTFYFIDDNFRRNYKIVKNFVMTNFNFIKKNI